MHPLPKAGGIVLALLLFVAAMISGCATTPSRQVMFQAMVNQPGDQIEIVRGPETTAFRVTSPDGIGAATITLWQGDWPSDVRVRLRYAEDRPFTKVEGFTVAIGRKRPVEISEITYASDYAEVRLPGNRLNPAVREIHMQWVDYYR